jgi:thiosulfate dehydrogenase (quinone) large subunit
MALLRSAPFRKFAVLSTRFGLASTFIAGVADRFGAWGRPGAPHVSWGDMQHFASRIQAIVPQAPAALALVLAWLATVLDSALGLGLLIGLRTRTMAFASGVVFLVQALAMAVSPGGLHATLAGGLLAMAGGSMLLAAVSDDTW